MKPIYRFGLAGAALILITNVVILSWVTHNRGGEPEAVVSVTERELSIPYRRGIDNSGLSLRLQWRVANTTGPGRDSHWNSPDWLGVEKLKELGFKIDSFKNRQERRKRGKNTLARQVLIVLEYDGNAYVETVAHTEEKLKSAMAVTSDQPDHQEADRKLKDARQRLAHERHSASRLFAVDAGTDPVRLRARYPDKSRYLILQGMVDLRYDSKPEFEPRGYIARLLNNSLNVSLTHRYVIENAVSGGRSSLPRGKKPRYSVELACGRSFEPWIREVAQLVGK
jgi:hypothetical protein